MQTFNITGLTLVKGKSKTLSIQSNGAEKTLGVGKVTDRFSDTDFNVEVDERDADKLTEWVEENGGEAKLV